MRVLIIVIAGLALSGCASDTALGYSSYIKSFATPHAITLGARAQEAHVTQSALISLHQIGDEGSGQLYYQPFLATAYPESSREVFRCFNNDETPLIPGYKSCIYRCRTTMINMVIETAKLCPRNYEFSDIAQGMFYFYGDRLAISHSILGMPNEP